MTRTESVEEKNRRKRTQSRLSSKLEKSLWAYTAAASAAGVGMLAAAPAAEAKIVYTPVNAVVNEGYAIDLNHDGIVDFYIVHGGAASVGGSLHVTYLDVCHIPENGASHQCVQSSSSIQPNKDNTVRVFSSGAAALPAGAKIANGEKFQLPGFAVEMAGRKFYSGSNTAQVWEGPWANRGKGTTNRYLGFKFKINGEFHYGWARLTVATSSQSYIATLTGYAYETIPGKPIVAGQESGPAEIGDNIKGMSPTSPTVAANNSANAAYRPVSLGLLGLGAAGLAIWRREDDPPASGDQTEI